MAKVIYKDVTYDSQEELDFKHWLDEAFEYGLINEYKKLEKGIDTFELIGKQYYLKDNKKKHCFASVEYTPDFVVTNCDLVKDRPTQENIVYVDVKGAFSMYNDAKQFQIIRKMMYHFKRIYIHKIVPHELFQKTWVPELARYTKVTGVIQRRYRLTPTIKEYLKAKKEA